MAENIDSANAAASTLFLGQNGEWWDFWLIVSVIIAASAAIAIGIATTGSVVSHKREAASAESALEQFKLQTEEKISDANARAEEAKLELAKFRAPRVLTPEQKATIVNELRGKVTEINVVAQPEVEARAYSFQFASLLRGAGIKVNDGSLSPMDTAVLASNESVVIWSKDWQAKNGFPNPNDPLYRAISMAGLWGGSANVRFIPDGSKDAVIPDIPTIYIFQKKPW